MSAEVLHRIQFGLTISFHFIFPPMSLGLGLVLIIFGVQAVRTDDPKWRRLSMFWTRVYGLVFAMGIATGIVQEFQFGTNWAVYSRYVGNIFGSLLAAEGIFAFMLEGGFLGLMLAGGRRLGNRLWLFATTMVVAGATFSATWIIMANSWMQTPQGYELRDDGHGTQAFMSSFRDVVFTPSFGPRLWHTLVASWMVGTSLVLSVAAYYLLKRRHVQLATTMIRVTLPVFTVLAVLQVTVFGANMATEVATRQPAKLAAMEGVYRTQDCAPMTIVGWTNPAAQTTEGIQVPCLLSLLVGQSTSTTVQGLDDVPRDQWADVPVVFHVYHLMINAGMLFVLIGGVACVLWAWKRKLWEQRWMLRVLVASIVLTQIATLSGWWTAELGRQPWIVWQLLRTSDAFSPNVGVGQVGATVAMFAVLYTVVLGVFLFLLDRIIKAGPPDEPEPEEIDLLPDTWAEAFRHRSRASSGSR
ncbi:MAG: cytochrome ubiquinol oxidase subunit I [Actinobacteria bacterium]|nr:cytochrome ubiquinol oxidase subunit I [Actinomycetota bacterium]